jgi:hypothetical protein
LFPAQAWRRELVPEGNVPAADMAGQASDDDLDAVDAQVQAGSGDEGSS